MLLRLALLWSRYLGDKEYSLREIGRMKHGNVNDHNLIFRLPTVWILRCNPDPNVVSALREYLEPYIKSKSGKVKWHVNELKSLTDWADNREVD